MKDRQHGVGRFFFNCPRLGNTALLHLARCRPPACIHMHSLCRRFVEAEVHPKYGQQCRRNLEVLLLQFLEASVGR